MPWCKSSIGTFQREFLITFRDLPGRQADYENWGLLKKLLWWNLPCIGCNICENSAWGSTMNISVSVVRALCVIVSNVNSNIGRNLFGSTVFRLLSLENKCLACLILFIVLFIYHCSSENFHLARKSLICSRCCRKGSKRNVDNQTRSTRLYRRLVQLLTVLIYNSSSLVLPTGVL